LGEADASASPIKAAAANLEKAEADYALKKRRQMRLTQRKRTAEQELIFARHRRDAAVKAVAIKADPAVQRSNWARGGPPFSGAFFPRGSACEARPVAVPREITPTTCAAPLSWFL
jgi:hypothetical protein